MLRIIEKTKIWFIASAIIILIGFGAMAKNGLQYGIDFKGGTLVTINMEKDFVKEDVDVIVKKYAKDASTNVANKTQIEIKSVSLNETTISNLFKEIKDTYKLKDSDLVSQSTIGATMGTETRNKAFLAIILANLAMLIYIGIRFEFKFATAAILALVHDVLITLAVYAVFKLPINSGFVAAMLTVIGYSINDTIVVFDRIRENQKYMRREEVTELANASITQTIARSINTVLTVLITLVAVYFCVPTVKEFTFPLIIGIVSGCYSSVFIASPIWVMLKNKAMKRKLLA